jgi:hypothetical protein
MAFFTPSAYVDTCCRGPRGVRLSDNEVVEILRQSTTTTTTRPSQPKKPKKIPERDLIVDLLSRALQRSKHTQNNDDDDKDPVEIGSRIEILESIRRMILLGSAAKNGLPMSQRSGVRQKECWTRGVGTDAVGGDEEARVAGKLERLEALVLDVQKRIVEAPRAQRPQEHHHHHHHHPPPVVKEDSSAEREMAVLVNRLAADLDRVLLDRYMLERKLEEEQAQRKKAPAPTPTPTPSRPPEPKLCVSVAVGASTPTAHQAVSAVVQTSSSPAQATAQTSERGADAWPLHLGTVIQDPPRKPAAASVNADVQATPRLSNALSQTIEEVNTSTPFETTQAPIDLRPMEDRLASVIAGSVANMAEGLSADVRAMIKTLIEAEQEGNGELARAAREWLATFASVERLVVQLKR